MRQLPGALFIVCVLKPIPNLGGALQSCEKLVVDASTQQASNVLAL